MKTVVTVSRKWDNPQIEINVSNEEISLKMSMDDFREALIQELGSVATTFTSKGIRAKVNKAIDAVILGIKEESIKVV